MFGVTVSTLQTGVTVEDGVISGTLNEYQGWSSGPLEGEGHFLALKFSSVADNITSVKVGVDPSQGTGLVELDSDLNAVFKIKDTDQKLVVLVSDGKTTQRYVFSLEGLTLAD